VPQYLSECERVERAHVNAELRNLRIAKECGEPTLPTAGLRWDDHGVSANPLGALTPVVARETLTAAATRRQRARQRAARSGSAALLRTLLAA
jgi:hypothetical protein